MNEDGPGRQNRSDRIRPARDNHESHELGAGSCPESWQSINLSDYRLTSTFFRSVHTRNPGTQLPLPSAEMHHPTPESSRHRGPPRPEAETPVPHLLPQSRDPHPVVPIVISRLVFGNLLFPYFNIRN